MTIVVELQILGMDCPSCGAGIERALLKDGLTDARVDFSKHLLRVTPNEEFSLQQIIERIDQLGFKARPSENSLNETAREAKIIRWQIIISAIFTAPLLGHMFFNWHVLHEPLVQLFLSTPVLIIGLSRFGRSAVKSLQSGYPNMDTLIVLGSSAAYIYSLVGIVIGRATELLFFETSASIITIVLIGNLLERRSLAKMNEALQAFSKSTPIKARKVDQNGEISEIDQEKISLGDTLHLRTGDQVPADGIVKNGEMEVDQAILTGESTPILRRVGDRVIGGSVVYSGSGSIEATAIGNESVISGIINLIDTAQTRKPEIQRSGDLVSAIFTPTVLSIAILTWLLSWSFGVGFGESLIRSVAVLVIACPCAMGLATPTAVMIGLGRAAKNGILVRGGDVFERLSEINAVVFDKTGTITTGKFTIKNITTNQISTDEAKSIIKSLENISSHPIARSIVENLKDSSPANLSDLKEITGVGVSGRDINGSTYTFGSKAPSGHQFEGSLILFRNQAEVAYVEIEDQIDPEAITLITDLKKMNYKIFLVSGDSNKKCQELNSKLKFDEVYSEQSPSQKLEIIEKLQERFKVAFVGDGVNDGPALAKANVGISLSEATQIAIQSADVVLLGRTLKTLKTTLLLGKTTLRTIKENLFWAFSYNIVAIPLAALGFLTPIVGAFAMAFSDVMTIGNSLRLRKRNLR